jgi:PST family polysaccharide transporter
MRKEIAQGAAWMVFFRLIDRSLGLISTAILARLLLPADFGLVAMAMSIIGLIELATAFSFEIALIQMAKPERGHYDTAFTLNVLLAVGGAAVTAALAYPAAAFYGEPRLVLVMFAIGGAWLIAGFENIGTVNFRRNMDFGREFRFLAYKRVISFGVAIAAAFMLRSYWALVIGMVTGRAAGVILSYIMEPFRPRLSLAASRQLFTFSGWMLVTNIAGAVISKIPSFFVGRMFGAQTLGAYTVGAEIAQLTHTELVAPINRAMIPGYSRLADDIDAFRRTCIDSAAAILLLVLPASVGIALLAGPLVRVLLGEQWTEAVPVIQVLAFSGAVNAIISNNHAAYVALGRPNLSALILLSRVAVLIPLLLLLSTRFGLLGIVYAELLAAAASLFVSYPLLFRQLRIPVIGYLRALWRPLLASAAMAASVQFVLQSIASDPGIAAAVRDLVTGVAVGVVTYCLMLWSLWKLSRQPDTAEVALARYAMSAGRSWINR